MFDASTATQRFVIATVDYLALLLTPALQRLVAAEAPGVRLAIHALDAEPITQRLAEGVVQLYIGVRGETERALETQVLHREQLGVLVRPNHPLAAAELSAEAYANAEHVHVSPRREAGSLVDRGLAAVGHTRTVVMEVPYFALLPDLLEQSDLLATVPMRIARHFEHEFGLVVREVPIVLPAFDVCMAWHPTFATEPSLVWLRETVARIEFDAGRAGINPSRSTRATPSSPSS